MGDLFDEIEGGDFFREPSYGGQPGDIYYKCNQCGSDEYSSPEDPKTHCLECGYPYEVRD